MVLIVSYLLLISVMMQWLIDISQSLVCNHIVLNRTEIITGITIDRPPIKTKTERPPFSPIRIHFELTESFTSYKNSDKLVNEVLLPAKKSLELLVTVKNPLNGILRVDRQCTGGIILKNSLGETGCKIGCEKVNKCAGVEVPMKFLKKCKMMGQNGHLYYEGPDSDFLLDADIALITVVEKCEEGTVGAAASCYLEAQLDRPILGILILCQGRINPGEGVLMNIATVQHEIIHALGFSVDKYAFYRYQDGTPMVPRNINKMPETGYDRIVNAYLWTDAMVKQVSRRRSSTRTSYEKTVYALTLPTVMKVAREHFNCSTLDGVDLEPYPTLSHFDEYILYNELMTPMLNNALTKISKLSLALLKDTGWYDVKFDEVNDFHYGENKGCEIINDGCYAYMNTQRKKGLSILPFCEKPFYFGNVFTCDEQRRYYYYCDLHKKSHIDEKYQYFKHLNNVRDEDTKFYAGYLSSYDYCPPRTVPSNPNSICSDTNNNPEKNKMNILNSYFGQDSACFENGLVNKNYKTYFGASCQKFYSDKKAKTLEIYIADETVFCPSNKTYILSGKFGQKVTFVCPNIAEFQASIGTKIGKKETPKKVHMAANRTVQITYFVIVICKISNLFYF